MKKENIYRGAFYITGLLILAMGITLTTKSGLGVTPIISVSFSVSQIFNLNFGNTTFALYAIFVLIEIILHIIKYGLCSHREKLFLLLLKDILQFPLSLLFTRFLNLFGTVIPELKIVENSLISCFLGRFLFLILAVAMTGIGAAMTLNMQIIPNPGDGIVQALADFCGKSVGLTKNCFDFLNICITIGVSMVYVGRITGIGLGTIVAMIGVGRFIALFNYLCKRPMANLSGLS
ncbi:MAG: hypothetical protein Q4B70_15305 [Lachnospiraceae bacterium]|nr:hypothetical protein [Lachnospiraceae bacterium]